jgi:hypothetical protein
MTVNQLDPNQIQRGLDFPEPVEPRANPNFRTGTRSPGHRNAMEAETTQTFFATVQNQLHFAIHGRTAAELIVARADSTKEQMG